MKDGKRIITKLWVVFEGVVLGGNTTEQMIFCYVECQLFGSPQRYASFLGHKVREVPTRSQQAHPGSRMRVTKSNCSVASSCVLELFKLSLMQVRANRIIGQTAVALLENQIQKQNTFQTFFVGPKKVLKSISGS